MVKSSSCIRTQMPKRSTTRPELTPHQDNSDPQYHSFRSNLPNLLSLATVHLIYSLISSRLTTSASAKATSIAIYATIMLVVLHGISTLKIYAILAMNYHLALAPKPPVMARFWPALVVAGNMGVLFVNHKYDGYHFGSVLPRLGLLVSSAWTGRWLG